MRRRVIGWAAVAAQLAVIVAILVSVGTSAAGPRWTRLAGALCFMVGVLVLAAALLNLGRALTPSPVPNGGQLQQGGMYRYVRHPIYSGVLLAMLGVVLRSPGWWQLAWWLVLLLLLELKARWEERMLSERFSDYPAYMLRTGRFVPRLRGGQRP